MKSFAMNESGDLIIENNEIQMVENEELIRQTVREIINTNKGEWFFDWEMGIDFSNILGKGVTEEMVQAEIEEGLQQVDEVLHISDFTMSVEGRKLKVTFTAKNEETDEEIEVIEIWH